MTDREFADYSDDSLAAHERGLTRQIEITEGWTEHNVARNHEAYRARLGRVHAEQARRAAYRANPPSIDPREAAADAQWRATDAYWQTLRNDAEQANNTDGQAEAHRADTDDNTDEGVTTVDIQTGFTTGSDAPQRSVTRAEYDAWWNTLTPQQQDAEMARWYAEVDGAPPPTGQCIDSDTQVMVPARPADAVFCGSCGSQVGTSARPGDENEIPFVAAHSMGGEDAAADAKTAIRRTAYTASLRGDGGRLADIPGEFATEGEAINNARKVAAEQHLHASVVDLYAKTTINDTLTGYPCVGWAWTNPPTQATEATNDGPDSQGDADEASYAEYAKDDGDGW